jgi:hypothetical protein
MLLIASLLLQMSAFASVHNVLAVLLLLSVLPLPVFLLWLSSLLLLVANVNAIAYVIDVALHACCCCHCCCCWGPLISWCSHCYCCWPSCYFWRPWCCWDSCCCFSPAVASAPAVSGVLAVASVPTDPGVPILVGILYNETYQFIKLADCRTMAIRLLIFSDIALSACGRSDSNRYFSRGFCIYH